MAWPRLLITIIIVVPILCLKDKNIVFLGVDLQDTEKNALDFLAEFNVSYPDGRDASGRIAVDYGVWGIPERFFIDPQGRITYKHIDGIRAVTVAAKLEDELRGMVTAQEGRGEVQSVR